MLMSSFSNDENVRLPTLLKADPITDILIDQIHKELLLRMPAKSWYCFIKGILFKRYVSLTEATSILLRVKRNK